MQDTGAGNPTGGGRALRALVCQLVHELSNGLVEFYRSRHYHRAPRWQARFLVDVLNGLPREYTRDPRLAPALAWANRYRNYFEVATEPRKASPSTAELEARHSRAI